MATEAFPSDSVKARSRLRGSHLSVPGFTIPPSRYDLPATGAAASSPGVTKYTTDWLTPAYTRYPRAARITTPPTTNFLLIFIGSAPACDVHGGARARASRGSASIRSGAQPRACTPSGRTPSDRASGSPGGLGGGNGDHWRPS